MSRSYPEPNRPRPTLPDPFRPELPPDTSWTKTCSVRDSAKGSHRRAPERQWNCLQVAALVLVVEALCFVALIWGQGWRP